MASLLGCGGCRAQPPYQEDPHRVPLIRTRRFFRFLPEIGQECCRSAVEAAKIPAMAGADDLLDHLERSTPLSRGEADRVVREVLAYYAETAEQFVRRRHAELARRGL